MPRAPKQVLGMRRCLPLKLLATGYARFLGNEKSGGLAKKVGGALNALKFQCAQRDLLSELVL